ncbi:hypothetical protein AALT_g3491 [Alternaria alternata]|nr:hypothetical protein AALT_g3491 [Alternaria alternata]
MQLTFLLSVLAATVAVQASDVYNQCVPDKDCCFTTKGACQRQASVWIEKYFQCGQVKKCPDYGISLQDCPRMMLGLHAAPPRQAREAELPQQHATYQSLYQRLVLARNASKPCPISIRYSFTHQFISCAEIAPEAMGGVAEFKHEPLPDSTTHIRLLKIKSVDAEDRVVCLLTAWPMEEAPEYYALSYTWGSPTPSHQILINGCVFTAGQNCVYALKQAHAAKANGLFGVLALVRWGNTEPPAPDYGKSNYEIAIEVLRLCLYDFETQLILGVAFEWPRLLWKVFDVLVEVNVLWEALSKTYGSPKIPDIWLQVNLAFHRGSDGYRSGKLSRKIQANQNSLEEFPSATPPRPLGFKGHPGDTWYGTRLLAFDDQNLPHSRNPVPHYLCCCEDDSNDSASSSDSMALNAWIMDQYQRPFAHVVYTDIRPNDWLLISEADYCRGNDEEMLVVRVTDGVSGLYRILGRALAEDQHRVILRSLCWEYFGSSWNVEDLFFWDWAYNSDPSGDLKHSDWVARVILTRGDSPSFYGPTTHTQDDDIEQQT